MRTLVWMAATFALVTLSLEAQAKDLSKNSRFVCS